MYQQVDEQTFILIRNMLHMHMHMHVCETEAYAMKLLLSSSLSARRSGSLARRWHNCDAIRAARSLQPYVTEAAILCNKDFNHAQRAAMQSGARI